MLRVGAGERACGAVVAWEGVARAKGMACLWHHRNLYSRVPDCVRARRLCVCGTCGTAVGLRLELIKRARRPLLCAGCLHGAAVVWCLQRRRPKNKSDVRRCGASFESLRVHLAPPGRQAGNAKREDHLIDG